MNIDEMLPPGLADLLGISHTLPDYLPPQSLLPGLRIQYFEEWRRIHGDQCPNAYRYGGRFEESPFRLSLHLGFRCRDRWCQEFAWAVPSPEALLRIARLRLPICEVGAGAGYWGYLLRCLGVRCFLYDLHPPDRDPNHWAGTQCWTHVERGGVRSPERHPDAALFLCWPPYSSPMAYRTLQSYRGDTVIFIGESAGGCTGDDRFFDLLGHAFEEEEQIHLPQYSGIHDDLYLFRRK